MLKRTFSLLLALLMVCAAAPKSSASDVELKIEGGKLTFRGDSGDNKIWIDHHVRGGDIHIHSSNGTTINGLPTPFITALPKGRIDEMEFHMGDGDDVVGLLYVHIAGDLSVDLGAGDDEFESSYNACHIGGNMEILCGSGDDTILMEGSKRHGAWHVYGDLKIDGERGSLVSTMNHFIVEKNFTVIGTAAYDDILFGENCWAGSTSLETKEGNDVINVDEFYGHEFSLESGGGDDYVDMRDVGCWGQISVSTGKGSDDVSMFTVYTYQDLKVSLDDGDDTFVGDQVSAGFDAIFEGGADWDKILFRTDPPNSSKLEIKEFEVGP